MAKPRRGQTEGGGPSVLVIRKRKGEEALAEIKRPRAGLIANPLDAVFTKPDNTPKAKDESQTPVKSMATPPAERTPKAVAQSPAASTEPRKPATEGSVTPKDVWTPGTPWGNQDINHNEEAKPATTRPFRMKSLRARGVRPIRARERQYSRGIIEELEPEERARLLQRYAAFSFSTSFSRRDLVDIPPTLQKELGLEVLESPVRVSSLLAHHQAFGLAEGVLKSYDLSTRRGTIDINGAMIDCVDARFNGRNKREVPFERVVGKHIQFYYWPTSTPLIGRPERADKVFLPYLRIGGVVENPNHELIVEVTGELRRVWENGCEIAMWSDTRKRTFYVYFGEPYPTPGDVGKFVWIKGFLRPSDRTLHISETETLQVLSTEASDNIREMVRSGILSPYTHQADFEIIGHLRKDADADAPVSTSGQISQEPEARREEIADTPAVEATPTPVTATREAETVASATNAEAAKTEADAGSSELVMSEPEDDQGSNFARTKSGSPSKLLLRRSQPISASSDELEVVETVLRLKPEDEEDPAAPMEQAVKPAPKKRKLKGKSTKISTVEVEAESTKAKKRSVGRPPKDPSERASQQIAFRIKPLEAERLKELSSNVESMNQTARRVLLAILEEPELFEEIKRLS